MSSASDGPPSPRLSKFSRLYVGARFGPAAAAAGPVGGTLDTARQYLPYSLVRKAVAVQRQREQRLMAINRFFFTFHNKSAFNFYCKLADADHKKLVNNGQMEWGRWTKIRPS
jgi:hypothetical protein